MLRVTMAMQTDDRGGLVITRWRRDSGKTQRLQRLAKRVEAFFNTDDLGCEGGGFCTFNANRSGLFWSPIRSRSSNPFVMNSVTSAPFSSSNALVPRVVARCMVSEGSGLDAIVPVARRAARIGASMSKTISIAWPSAVPSGSGLAKRSDCSVDCSVIAMGSVA